MGTRGKSFVLIALGAICSVAALAVVVPFSGDVERQPVSPGSAGWEVRISGLAGPTNRRIIQFDEGTATDPAILSGQASGLTWKPGDLTPRQ